MEETVDQNLLEISAEQFFRERAPVEFHPGEGTEVGDLFAVHVFHRQNARAAVVRDRFRDDNVRKRAQIFANRGEVVRLLPVIEFAHEALPKFIEHLAKLVALADGRMVVEEFGDLIDRVEVLEHRFANSRALDFHRHRAAVPKAGEMHLA